MSTFLIVIHVVVALILVISVLLQAGKGGGMGAAFGGGSSSSLFGAQGPATVMSKITTVAAIIFMVTSLSLSLFIKSGRGKQSLMEGAFLPAVSESVPPDGASPTDAPNTDAPASGLAGDEAALGGDVQPKAEPPLAEAPESPHGQPTAAPAE